MMTCLVFIGYSQNCQKPFNIKFENRKTTSIDVSWSDINTAPLGWEIELIKKGEVRTGIANFKNISEKKYTFTNLTPSTAYEIFIRAVCSATKYSEWNAAIPFTTVLEIPTACQINVPLKDNGTEILLLDVPQTGILGKNVFLKSVDLIIEHSWPADLKITLESPQGQQLLLSGHNGIASNNFGDVSDSFCNRFTTFSPDACKYLKDDKPPFIDHYKPDGNLETWRPDTLSKGYWKLIVFDRAVKDAGVLKYLNLNFSKELCVVPQNFTVSNTDINSITVTWDYKPPCQNVRILINENGNIVEKFVECKEGKFVFNNLLPNTEYEFTISSECPPNSPSLKSCTIKAQTSCETITETESFDELQTCKEGCAAACELNNSIWQNVKADDGQDWILWKGKTDTENTGPDGDINNNGNYIYIENNPQLCGKENAVILESSCMDIGSNTSGCDISFYYNMYGIDCNILTLEISVDNGITWAELFRAEGDQGSKWKRVTLSLSAYANTSGKFRFKGVSGDGPLGDIAIDQIEFYKSKPKSGPDIYYADVDGDGYGMEGNKIEICSSIPPAGYARIKGDCDDTNAAIHPSAIEIQCNAIDENCNGNEDDSPDFNPILVQANIKHSTCNGSHDGEISLQISGGTSPYTVLWNNGLTGSTISQLPDGIYYAKITDFGGCKVKTAYFQVNILTNLKVIITELTKPSCKGRSDGVIAIEHNNENGPYQYLWSNGAITKNLTNVPEGMYHVTVTDINNCFATLNNIALTSKPSVITGIATIKHPLCNGLQTGQISLITVNGLPPYNYKWSTGDTTDQISNLPAGIYKVTVSDAAGCNTEFETKITQPEKINIKIVSTEAVRCFGENNGSIKTDVSGGTAPYTFLWNSFAERTDDIFGLTAGDYMLTVTDANGCKNTTEKIRIQQPAQFVLSIDSIRKSSCILGQNGLISLTATGGNGDYNYVWNHSDLSVSSFDNLLPGNYNVTAYDKLGCKTGIPNIKLEYINLPIDVSIELLKDNTCYKDTNAIISSKILGGKADFDYNWSQGEQYFSSRRTDTLTHLGAGLYKLSVTDADGCTGFSNGVLIKEKDPYTYTITEIKNNLCQTDTTGAITIQVDGAVEPKGISWNGGLYAGSQIDKLINGSYHATVIDANNCVLEVLPVIISSESDITTNPIIQNEKNNGVNGEICVFPTGGFLPYKFIWNNGSSNDCIYNLKAGTYSVTITDNKNCAFTETYKIENTSGTDDEKDGFYLYPNPSTDYLNIRSNQKINEIKIFDINGRLLRSIVDINDRISVQDLVKGVYILQLNTVKDAYEFKLLKN